MGKNMQVFVRLFPSPERDIKDFQVSPDLLNVSVKCSKSKDHDNYVTLQTSGVLVNISQEDLYLIISRDLIFRLFKGENIIILVNGQHKSGKSFTMTGYNGSYENRGITWRLIEDLYNEITQQKNKLKVQVEVSYTEFALETVTDLLTEPASRLKKLTDARKLKVKRKDDLMKVLMDGEKRRWTEGQAGSHCASSVVTIYLTVVSKLRSEPSEYNPRIQLVELSGTESVNKTISCQTKANTDMTYISQYLATNKHRILTSPSRIVSLLSQTWNSAFIRIISHLIPTAEKRSLNMSTIVFTGRLQHRPLYNVKFHTSTNALALQDQAIKVIERLENELLVREMISGQGFRHTNTVSQEEMDLIQKSCSQYLEGELSLESLLSLAHPYLLVRAFKEYYHELSKRGNENGPRLPENGLDKYKSTSGSRLSSSEGFTKSGVRKRSRLQQIKMSPQQTPFNTCEKSDTSVVKKFEPIPDRQTIEAEFFTRYPDIKTQLDLAVDNYHTAMRLRDELYSSYETIKMKARQERVEDEDMMWKRRIELGNCVGKDGKPYWDIASDKPAEHQAAAAKSQIMEVLTAYSTARDLLDELKASIEKKIEDYVRKAYGVETANLYEIESLPCYVTPNNIQSTNKVPKDDNQDKNLFYSLQASNRPTNSYRKKPRYTPYTSAV